ncbi:DUF4181 domain-containing protein [Bacillus manliponensis]|uniref:DUF4181 domain-containing protein n=1 Tax=Bacillus manliponensis TaxID=574376 RepID=UPI00068F26DA|nr:DUF4181 domain-containing protein [Bacillus manliponensis]
MFLWKVIFVVVMFIALLFLEKLLRRKWDIPRKSITERYVNKTHKWIDIGIITIYLMLGLTSIFILENFMLSFYMMVAFLVTQWTVRTWMEWKYDRESKEYVITIGSMGSAVAVVILMKYLFF